MDVGFEYAEKKSKEVLGYELPQILLIHCNELNSVTLAGHRRAAPETQVQLITLEEAMDDPAYQEARHLRQVGRSWLSRTATRWASRFLRAMA